MAPTNNMGMTHQKKAKNLTKMTEYFVGVLKLAISS
jgi:hypothetical protein